MSYTVHYRPPVYGEIIPSEECKHDPAGHRMELGTRVETVGKKRRMARDGWFCMKCGAGEHVEAENWIDLWWATRSELSGKCPQFDIRLTELAEAACGDFGAFILATGALYDERQATAIGEASR